MLWRCGARVTGAGVGTEGGQTYCLSELRKDIVRWEGQKGRSYFGFVCEMFIELR